MHPPALHPLDIIGPTVAGLVFILIMGFVREPARREWNAIFVAGATGAYLNGGLGPWELVFAALADGVLAYLALRSYRMIGVAWLAHSAWDLVHHFYGHPIWSFMPTSSFGCTLFDAVIALWFIAGARPLVGKLRKLEARQELTGEARTT